MKSIAYSKVATRALFRLPADVSSRIVDKIEQYAENPASRADNVKKLQGREGYRLRVGDWRVIFDETDVVLVVLEIGARGGIYD